MAKANKLTVRSGGRISPAIPADVQVIEHGRDIHMYKVTDEELDTLARGHHSLNLFFFSLCIGALMILFVTLLTITLTDRIFATFIALTCVLGILGTYFGIKACIERRAINQGIKQIRESREVST